MVVDGYGLGRGSGWVRFNEGGSGNVLELDCVAHLGGDALGKGADLFVYVHQKGVAGPAAKLLDGVPVDAVQLHGHGTASAEQVTADGVFGKATGFEAEGGDNVLHEGIDVARVDVLGSMLWGVVGG